MKEREIAIKTHQKVNAQNCYSNYLFKSGKSFSKFQISKFTKPGWGFSLCFIEANSSAKFLHQLFNHMVFKMVKNKFRVTFSELTAMNC